MKLSQLTAQLNFLEKRNFNDLEISSITPNSAEVGAGSLFVAIIGTKTDGHLFVQAALAKGASALVVEKEVSAPKHIPVFRVANGRASLSALAAQWHGQPSRRLPVIGITGTNGKTTVSHLLAEIFRTAGKNPGIIGTLGYHYNGTHESLSHTTPESTLIQKIIADMERAQVDIVSLEASSHAIDMRRVEDILFDAAIFTNLTPEHLDYHMTMELYFESKKRLFLKLLTHGKGPKQAVINADDAYGQRLLELTQQQKPWSFSTKAQSKSNFYAQSYAGSLAGMQGTIATPQGSFEFHSPLIGVFNLSNILAAVAGATAMKIPLEFIKAGVENFPGVAGRLERIENSRGIHVFVDFAHTPDAIKNVLRALRQLNPARILTVFGCGGNRDRGKRPMMGREAARLSDLVFLTSDNPRCEDPLQIIEAIKPGLEEGGMTLGREACIEPDRAKAIAQAIGQAQPGDVVLIAGKGHETYQILANETLHFDDREIARAFLNHD